MISASKLKLIPSLGYKKYRDRHQLFLAEGEKLVMELLPGKQIKELIATPEWIEANLAKPGNVPFEITEADQTEINKISFLVSPRPVMALVSMPDNAFDPARLEKGPILAFESIRDPGNLGTIIRTADWFGIRNILCTPDSTDLFNPKVVQSTMGAIARVRVHYLDLQEAFRNPALSDRPLLGTFLEGRSIYESNLDLNSIILFGNESKGISPGFEKLVQEKITIPSFSDGQGSESLNVASSAAVICSELKRRKQEDRQALP